MNITEALPVTSLGNLAGESKQSQESNSLSFDALLFSLFLNNYSQEQFGAEQVSGELGEQQNTFIAHIQANSDLGHSPNRNFYLQILQDLFPAGKEANSGLGVEQNPITLFSTEAGLSGEQKDLLSAGSNVKQFDSGQFQVRQGQIFKGLEIPKALLGADKQPLLERVNPGTVLPEQHNSVQTQELAKNIQISKQLSEMAGRIEISPGSSEKLAESALRQNYNDFILWSQQNQEATAELQTERLRVTQMLNALNREQPANQTLANEQNSKTFQQSSLAEGQAMFDINGTAPTSSNPQSAEKTSAEPLQIMEQLLDALKRQDWTPTKEVRELSIQLQPAELGKVNITMKLENGSLNLIFNTSEQTTGLLLQNSIQDLKNSLAQLGVTCGSFEMNYQPDGQPGDEARPMEQYARDGIYSENYDSDIAETDMFSQTNLNSYNGYNNSGYRINIRA